MKALVYRRPQCVEYMDHSDPVPEGGDVLIDIEAVGICGSDMHAYLGHDPRRVPPLILGHEVAGRMSDGRRVVINPLITCGACNACAAGRSNLCARRELIGMNRPGGFAERVAIPARNVIAIPDGLDAAHAALTEPAATAVHAMVLAARTCVRPISELGCLVVGGGSVGLFAALLANEQGAATVTIVETNPLRRETAKRLGIGTVIDPSVEAPQPDSFELIIDAVGGAASRQMAMRSVVPGGVIMHIGLSSGEGGVDMRKVTLSEITVIGTYTYTPVDLRAAVNKLASGALGHLAWIEERPLAAGAAAFADLLDGRCAAAKIVLRP